MNEFEPDRRRPAASSDEVLPDPPPPASEASPPRLTVADTLRRDARPPKDTWLQASDHRLGTDPIDAARYFSRAFAALEAERVWPRVWQFACWAEDIARPGDIHVYRILDRSVLIVRQRDGSLKAFVNACLHRGNELCADHARRSELKCSYHHFTWGLDGELKHIPSEWDFPQVRRSSFQLPQVRVEVWNGFVFINFDPDCAPLAQYLGRIVPDWADWDFDRRYKAAHVRKLINCNWKTCQDGFIEAWHAYASHPQSAPIVAADVGQQDVYADDPHSSRNLVLAGYPAPSLWPQPSPEEVFQMLCARFLPAALGTPEGRLAPGEDSRAGGARLARRALELQGVDTSAYSDSDILDSCSYFVFPNFHPWPSVRYPIFYRFLPAKDPDWCVWETLLCPPFSGERPVSCAVTELGPDDSFESVAALGPLGLLLQQDADQLVSVQRGMKNLVSGKITLSAYHELRIRHYHQTLDRYLSVP